MCRVYFSAFYEDCIIENKILSLCEILLMALMNPEKTIIRRRNLLPFHRLDFIRMIYNKSHTQAKNLPSCHEMENNCVFPRKRTIPEKTCLLTPILQGGIAFFAIFSRRFAFSHKTARNGNKSALLSGLRHSLDICRKIVYLPTQSAVLSRNRFKSYV